MTAAQNEVARAISSGRAGYIFWSRGLYLLVARAISSGRYFCGNHKYIVFTDELQPVAGLSYEKESGKETVNLERSIYAGAIYYGR